MAESKYARVKQWLHSCCGPALAVAALLTTLTMAWFRMAPDRSRQARQVADPTSLLFASEETCFNFRVSILEVAVVRRPGPLAHTSVLREGTLGFLRARHRTASTPGGLHSNRLPRALLPEHYDLEIRPFFAEVDGDHKEGKDDDAFTATVAIRVQCVTDTTSVVLHAGNFSFIPGPAGESATAVWQLTHPPTAVPVLSVERENESNFLVFKLGSLLKAGHKYVIQMRLRGYLGDARGFYKYHYDLNGKPEHLVVTFFEPTFAREAFPCFDEPDMKATFNVVVVRPSGYRSISTMPLMRSVRREGNTVADHFMTSVKMSTYTLAFMKSISFSDLIALPSFLVDAMENWGLLAFHRSSLLHDPQTEKPMHKIIVATVVAHELAHQWFGNLVTMRWWNDVWLNEGFASYMQYLGVNAVHPEWHVVSRSH
ncbi:aminopeptidase N-like [Ixodes scapularis]